MAIEKTVELKIDAKDALKRLEAVEKELSNISKTSKKNRERNKLFSQRVFRNWSCLESNWYWRSYYCIAILSRQI